MISSMLVLFCFQSNKNIIIALFILLCFRTNVDHSNSATLSIYIPASRASYQLAAFSRAQTTFFYSRQFDSNNFCLNQNESSFFSFSAVQRCSRYFFCCKEFNRFKLFFKHFDWAGTWTMAVRSESKLSVSASLTY